MKQLFLVFLLLIPIGSAATITGTVYDYGLQPVTDAIVSIDTTPEQTTVTEAGRYSLEVPKGEYTLKVHKATAKGLTEQAEATVKIEDEGTYTYDLILFQELQEFEEHDELEQLLEEKEERRWPYWVLVIIGAAIIAFSIGRKKKKRPKQEEQEDLESQVLTYIKRQGTTTQKDIRKNFPYSEAKISLVIASLETQGKVKKMKKGRGNIIKYDKVK